jgi:hypothetical protein
MVLKLILENHQELFVYHADSVQEIHTVSR